MPTTSAPRTDPSPSRGPAAAVHRAVASVSPTVTMWRDGLTIIALESREQNRPPDYLTFEQAQAADGIEVEEAPVQTVPTVDAATGSMPVLLLGGDTIIGGAQNRIGLGYDVRFSAPKLVGTALVYDRRALHVALFRPG
ncbi:MAG: hypothetical protein LC798_08130 [Chloroflexi bacterium]|nr:hypothetical protein [Chloroflexota bacterium]